MIYSDYISKSRLDIYEKHLKVQPSQVIAAYHWNKALSGAMLPAFQCLEVTLRNAINSAILSHPPKGSKGLSTPNNNWITDLPRYIGNSKIKPIERYKRATLTKHRQDIHGYLLDQYGNKILARKVKEENLVQQAKELISKEGKKPTPDRIISGLTFGFWVHLLTSIYEDTHGYRLLWPNLTPIVFPNAPIGYERSTIHEAFVRIKTLRNRLSHHEAIWKFHYDDPYTGKPNYKTPIYGAHASCNLLRKHYDDILDMIGWINSDRKNTFLKYSANLCFYALCSVNGLNSYIDPDKISTRVNISRGGRGIRKLLKVLSRNDFMRLTKSNETILTIGADNSMKIDNI